MNPEQNRDTIKLLTPAAWHRDMWREGLPIGNGVLGGLVLGAVMAETIIINHASLWHRCSNEPLPDVSHTLAECRRLIDKGNFKEANWASAKALKELGYENNLGSPLPLCAVNIDMGPREAFSKYSRSLHMDSAEAEVSWLEKGARVTRRAFLSRADDLLVVKVESEREFEELDVSLSLYDTAESDTENVIKELEPIETPRELPYQYYAARENGRDFGAVMLLETDGNITQGLKGLAVNGGHSCTVYVKFFIHGERGRDWARLRAELEALDKGYDNLLCRHKTLHEADYACADLILSDKTDTANEHLLLEAYQGEAPVELLEKLWHFGRYLMVCGTSRESNLPFPLYGVWPGRYSLPWPHNMANENLQMIYWHTEVGGMYELLRPMIRYFNERIEDFRQSAKMLFGLNGIYISAGTTPVSALPNQVVPVILNWIGAAGWMARHFYAFYQYSGDEKFFREEIWPFLRETAIFYTEYIVEEGGTCKIYPSVSPENTPQNLMPERGVHMSHPCPSVVNATMDVAIIKELFGIIIAEGGAMGEPEEFLETCKRQRAGLPEYETTPDGDIREWIYPGLDERYEHRHLSHIYPVFPGNEFIAGRDDEMLEHFALSVDKRILGSQTGWSLSHMSCIYSRLGRGESALECIDNLSRSCLLNSLFTLHNDWRHMGLTLGRKSFAPIQMDANMGVVNALQEMLLCAGDGFLRFLPALPERLNTGRAERFAFPGGRVSFEWNRTEKRFCAEITAARGVSVDLYLPPWNSCYSITVNGEERAALGLVLKAGETVIIKN